MAGTIQRAGFPWDGLHGLGHGAGCCRTLGADLPAKSSPSWVGALLGSGLWIALVIDSGLIKPIVRHGSIGFPVHPPWADLASHQVVTLLHASSMP